MTQSFLNFLKVTIAVTTLLFLFSFNYLVLASRDLDNESVMILMLLAAFSALAAIIQVFVYRLIKRQQP
jgi:hypothetical protein